MDSTQFSNFSKSSKGLRGMISQSRQSDSTAAEGTNFGGDKTNLINTKLTKNAYGAKKKVRDSFAKQDSDYLKEFDDPLSAHTTGGVKSSLQPKSLTREKGVSKKIS